MNFLGALNEVSRRVLKASEKLHYWLETTGNTSGLQKCVPERIMTRSKQTKRRRREGAVPYTTDSTEDDSASDDREYHHKSKGKEKLQEQEEQYTQEEDEEERAASPQVDDAIEQVCGICLTEEGEERGKLDCCDHYFCFGCIMEWAKVESRCPACKQRFVTIVRPALRRVPRSQQCIFRIPHRNQVFLLFLRVLNHHPLLHSLEVLLLS